MNASRKYSGRQGQKIRKLGEQIYLFVSRENKRIKLQNFPVGDTRTPVKRGRNRMRREREGRSRGGGCVMAVGGC